MFVVKSKVDLDKRNQLNKCNVKKTKNKTRLAYKLSLLN